MHDIKRLEACSVRMRGRSSNLNLLIKKSHRIKSERHSTKTYETDENMSSALSGVQRAGSEVHRRAVGASVLTESSAWKVIEGALCVMGCARSWESV